ncbi:MAG: signal peptide peptidase SppA [Planctomycetota bacterium]
MSYETPTPPPGVPPQEPQWRGGNAATPPREGRGVSFFVAIFLGLLLLVSAGLNVLLLLLSLGNFATAGMPGFEGEVGDYEVVRVGGDKTAKSRVLRIPILGAIAESQSPLIGASGGTVSDVRRALRYAEANDDVVGLWLAIDSPGGGVTDSDEIHRLLMKWKREHPTVRILASFGDIAASGGYYIACAADRIVARRSSITGSIGVIMSTWNVTDAARKLGIEQIVIKSEHTPYKDVMSMTRPMYDAEKKMLTSIVDELYMQFVDVVDAGRENLDREQVMALANGAIYSAGQALQNGLIDEIGDLSTFEAWFTDREAVQFVEYRRRPSIRDLLFGAEAKAPQDLAAISAHLLSSSSGPRFLYFWQGAR